MSRIVCTGCAVSALASMMATFSSSVRAPIARADGRVQFAGVPDARLVGGEARVLQQMPEPIALERMRSAIFGVDPLTAIQWPSLVA